MGFMSGLFNGSQGSGYQAQSTPIQSPVSTQDAQNSAAQQQNFLNSLAAQNGIGNQSSVFNQMQGTAGQLQNVANGQGPNPALAQLRQSTDQAIQQQAGALASTKGLNPALAAQMASQQGSQMMQNGANSAAQMTANQQLGALSALQGQQANMAGVAGQQVGQQQSGIQNQYAQQLNAINNQNQSNVGMQSNMNNNNSGVAQQNAKAQNQFAAGILQSGAQAGMGALMAAHGGIIPHMATGGLMMPQFGSSIQPMVAAPTLGVAPGAVPPVATSPSLGVNTQLVAVAPPPVYKSSAVGFLQGNNTPQLGDKEDSINQSGQDVGKFLGTAIKAAPALFKAGGPVPGKPKVAGDSLKNDTVPAMLSPGEIVIPRHVVNSSDPAGNAAKFVQAVMAKQSMRKKAK